MKKIILEIYCPEINKGVTLEVAEADFELIESYPEKFEQVYVRPVFRQLKREWEAAHEISHT